MLTKEQKIAVIQRGMARLPAMGEEAKWAFGASVRPDFGVPPPWVRRVVLLSFDVDPDAPITNEPTDSLKLSKMLGSMVGLGEAASIVLRPDAKAKVCSSDALDEEKLKQSMAAAAQPHLAKFTEQSGPVRQAFVQRSADHYAAFTAGQSDAAQAIAAEVNEPGSTSDMTQDLLMFLWMFWPEIPLSGSVRLLHQWITDLNYLHCSEKLVGKICRKAELRLSDLGAEKRSPTK
ncbi:MAG TPA: hypothetical protein VGD97_06845 [Lacunisphaera sp.]